MSLDIVSRTIGGELDKKFVLRNHQCARIMSIQGDWTRLRLGVRLAIEDTGAAILGSPVIWLGLLSSPSIGLSNGPLGTTTSHFVGIVSTGTSISRNAGPPVRYFAAFNGRKRVGSTNTTTAAIQNASFSGEPVNMRTPILVEFQKGSPNWTIRMVSATSGTGFSDVPFGPLVQAMEANTVADAEAILDTLGTYGNASQTIAVDEGADGLLNAVCFAWDRSTVDLEWSELLFAKFA